MKLGQYTVTKKHNPFCLDKFIYTLTDNNLTIQFDEFKKEGKFYHLYLMEYTVGFIYSNEKNTINAENC